MNREAILNTAVCYWSDEDDCYVVESPLFGRTAGVGDSADEALAHFIEMIDASLAEVSKGGLYQSPGRPPKGIININVQVKPATRDAIKDLQRRLKLSSQGEVVDFLAFYYHRTAQQRAPAEPSKHQQQALPALVRERKDAVYQVAREAATNERLDRIEERLSALERRMGKADK